MRYDLVISAAVALGDTCNNWYRDVSWGGCRVYSRRCRCSNVEVASGAAEDTPRPFVKRRSKISGERLDCILIIEWKKAEPNEVRTWRFMFSTLYIRQSSSVFLSSGERSAFSDSKRERNLR